MKGSHYMTSLIPLFSSLLFVHILADFYLQPNAWIASKVEHKERSLGLFKHMCTHFVLTAAVLFIFIQHLNAEFFIGLSTIILTHYAIDIWKTYMGFTFKYFVIDQAAHLAILFAVSVYISPITFNALVSDLITMVSIKHGVVLIAYLLSFKPLSILIQLLLRPYLTQFGDNIQQQGLQTAGEHIGALERALIITFILLGHFSAIGFLLAAKSVFRFGDMRRQHDRKLTEYIMLGTLLSFSFAIALGVLASRFL